ncbi:hypothetical protein METBIDRAFT_228187 [Metschnikowia bicuspidata var. bicuspidata NRRL YB-4993]|uniref:TRP C-terminal domain-containing protein n=1 Tax=Metschnikowia bicuspidata var. bicuspidata NRRL YB-4993 TaxID=869754 RepID=A0A1A0HFY9_9ASCO|nr:hypothetical protein METBIDRAFT_228187 [Metschnikowia bicuspidata var. bicuspidata NRRL YB-4993]OBA22812.1 hypothetical protein METBIDRAFT_228187 [Metschnikowia bicuspidata var. bicuspidata NRRL YB-4993]
MDDWRTARRKNSVIVAAQRPLDTGPPGCPAATKAPTYTETCGPPHLIQRSLVLDARRCLVHKRLFLPDPRPILCAPTQVDSFCNSGFYEKGLDASLLTSKSGLRPILLTDLKMFLRSLALLVYVSLLRSVLGGFIRINSFAHTNQTAVALDPLIVFVALDEELQLMKFLINSKVVHWQNASTTAPVISDVNAATNRYTTLHVEIDFMGSTFVDENLRFCDVLMVKNTSRLEDTYRFDGLSSSSASLSTAVATGLANPDIPGYVPNAIDSANAMDEADAIDEANAMDDSDVVDGRNVIDDALHVQGLNLSEGSGNLLFNSSAPSASMASSNASVEALFANKTGDGLLCPLYVNDSIAFYYQADVSQNYKKFGSYSVRLSVVSNNEESNIIGSGIGYVTSSSQNPFLIEASAICNEGLLKQLEATPLALVSYLQFALFMSGLNIQYPGFFHYLMGRIRWCALLGINIFYKWTSIPSPDLDNIYKTYYNGLKALAQYNPNGYYQYSWPNFILCLLIWTAVGLAGYQAFIFMKVLAQSHRSPSILRKCFGHLPASSYVATENESLATSFRYSWRTNMWALLGNLLREVLTTFGLPFLVLTIYMLSMASSLDSLFQEAAKLNEQNAFSATIPYGILNHQSKSLGLSSIEVRATELDFSKQRSGIPTLSIAFGLMALVAWFGSVFLFLYYYVVPVLIRGHPKQNVTKLYTSVKAIVTWAYLYNVYKPSKVYYVAVDIFGCTFSLIIIAALQNYPTAQVVLMIVLQFTMLTLLLTIRPHFLALTWHSVPALMHVCRFLVTVLNIPYLSQLEVSEAHRTYVAYAQMTIHFIFVVFYIVKLVYCLVITILAAVKVHKISLTEEKAEVENINASRASFLNEFEFKQVPVQAHLANTDPSAIRSSTASSLNDGEVDYYRSKSERVLRSLESRDFFLDTKVSNGTTTDEASLDYQQTEHRIRVTDYTTREADWIYQKCFSASEIDPEMRELWELRDRNKNTQPLLAKVKSSGPEKGVLASFWEKFTPKKEKGFEVVRRRPIVVKNTATADDNNESK